MPAEHVVTAKALDPQSLGTACQTVETRDERSQLREPLQPGQELIDCIDLAVLGAFVEVQDRLFCVVRVGLERLEPLSRSPTRFPLGLFGCHTPFSSMFVVSRRQKPGGQQASGPGSKFGRERIGTVRTDVLPAKDREYAASQIAFAGHFFRSDLSLFAATQVLLPHSQGRAIGPVVVAGTRSAFAFFETHDPISASLCDDSRCPARGLLQIDGFFSKPGF